MEAKVIANFASKDPTRYYLNSVYRDKDKFISTDGHRLIAVNVGAVLKAPPDTVNGRIYEASVFAKGGIATLDAQTRYPNWSSLIPDITKPQYKTVKTTVPNWFRYIKQGRQANTGIGLTASGDFTTATGDSVLVHINPAFLAEFADQYLTLYVGGPLDPIVIKDDEWTAVIMPMRR